MREIFVLKISMGVLLLIIIIVIIINPKEIILGILKIYGMITLHNV